MSRMNWHVQTYYHDEMWAKVLRRDPCSYCGAYGQGTVEHVDPRGSRSTVRNGVGACQCCNHERGSVPLLFYLLWRATDRSEPFHRWNFARNPTAIRHAQLLRKLHETVDEERAQALRVRLAEFAPETFAPEMR